MPSMTPSPDIADGSAGVMLELAVTPAGRFRLRQGSREAGARSPAAAVRRVAAAFEVSEGAGLLHLGVRELGTSLPPSLAFGRELARLYISRLCASPELEARGADGEVGAPSGALARLSLTAPPMPGAEYLDAEVLAGAWVELQTAVRSAVRAGGGDARAWVQGLGSGWCTVGRVCFHLAENKKDSERPFAFLATYARELTAAARLRYVPLARALKEYAGAGDRGELLRLLEPVQRASEQSELVRELLESRAIYRPLAWTPADAYRFLKDVGVLEESGVVVRVPDWWRARRASRPQVTVEVGGDAPSRLGARALLDFDVGVTLDGERLGEEELKALLAEGVGLRMIRGRWVEVDGARLQEVLDHWGRVQKDVGSDGLGFLDGMRMLAGVSSGAAADGSPDAGVAAWSAVRAGAWLSEVLAGLQRPGDGDGLDPGADLKGTLRPYQRQGVAWLRLLSGLGLGGCLADDMGLGKTIQVLALIVLLKRAAEGASDGLPAVPGPHLLVMPASLLGNWQAEIERFAPGLRALIAHRSAMAPDALASVADTEVEGVDVVLTTYTTLTRLDWMKERSWGLVVLDEAQAIKNPGTRQSRTVKGLRSQARLALTGTPIENRLGDLWSLFDFLCPGLLGSAAAFGRAAKAMEADTVRGFGPLRELTRSYILRRLKSDKRIIADLPEKVEVRELCGLTEPQAALYSDAVDDLRRTLESADGMQRRGAVLSSILRLKQICNHPSLGLGDSSFEPRRSGKLMRLRALCEEIAARQEKVLVFTQFRVMCEPIAAAMADVFGRPGLVLHGGTPVRRRPALVAELQDDAGPPFMVLSLRAGGTGLNLTAASHVVHFDRWWNPAVENQATDRAYRIGQKRNVLVHKLVCRGTVEEKIDALITSRAALSDDVLAGTGEAWLTEMQSDELLRTVSLDLQAALEES